MRRFYLFRRNQKNKIYYAQLINPLTGEKMPAKSTGCTDKDEAHFTVMSWLKEGTIPTGQDKRKIDDVFTADDILFRLKNADLNNDDTEKIIDVLKSKGLIQGAKYTTGSRQTLLDFLITFWTWETSPYIAEKTAYKQSIGHDHVDRMLRNIEIYWQTYFDENHPALSLTDLTRDMIREFSIWVSQQHKKTRDKEKSETDEIISPRTCNMILKAGTTALNWALNNGLINVNPAAGIKKFGLETKKRGILSDEEMKKLFESGDWKGNEAAKLICKLLSQTGLRIGEGIALQVKDIDSDRLQIRHSYSKVDGLKCPKNKETRQIPILPEIREQIIEYAKKNPYGYQPDHFIFWQADNPDVPMRAETVSKRFREAVDSILTDGERKARNIVLHGLRHYYIKKMADVMDKRAMMLSGHKSESVYETYADKRTEEDFQKAVKATAEIFGRILDFPQDKAQ